ncbi:hypothetical protein ACROYT_G015000 [Oculina patagonica]
MEGLFAQLKSSQTSTQAEDFRSLFLKEPLKVTACADSRGERWHPLVIRWCFQLYSTSPRANQQLKDSGILILPDSRTLRDYSNCYKSGVRLNPSFLDLVKKDFVQRSDPKECDCWLGLIRDEVSIRKELVFDDTGKLIGFIDLGDTQNSLINLRGCYHLSVQYYFLVLYVCNIVIAGRQSSLVQDLLNVLQTYQSGNSPRPTVSASAIARSLQEDSALAQNIGRVLGSSSSPSSASSGSHPLMPFLRQPSLACGLFNLYGRRKKKDQKTYDMKLVIVDFIDKVNDTAQTKRFNGNTDRLSISSAKPRARFSNSC